MNSRRLSLASAMLALTLLGWGCMPTPTPTTPEPTDNGQATAPDTTPYETQATLAVGQELSFEDGMTLTLKEINDSRCPANVQCIWAGELSPVVVLSGGTAGARTELRLGTETARQATGGGYTVSLVSATTTTATLSVAHAQLPAPTDEKHANLIRVSTPTAHTVVSSPLSVTGSARGTWYFEASFPVKLLDATGKVLAQAPAQAQGEWMTTEFVPFAVTLTFDKPTTPTGTLVFEKDNPSGLPEHDDSLSIPVRFED